MLCDTSPPLRSAYSALTPSSHHTGTGWADLRLLAPRAEVRLLLCGGTSLIDGHKLCYLGEAVRAMLVLEARRLEVGTGGSVGLRPGPCVWGVHTLCCSLPTRLGSPCT